MPNSDAVMGDSVRNWFRNSAIRVSRKQVRTVSIRLAEVDIEWGSGVGFNVRHGAGTVAEDNRTAENCCGQECRSTGMPVKEGADKSNRTEGGAAMLIRNFADQFRDGAHCME